MNAGMNQSLRWKLVGMMFLQYAVWGAWMPILGATLINRGFAPQEVGNTYAALWLACAISPFLGGQLVDRNVPSQWFLAASHGLAAVAAWVLAGQNGAQSVIIGMFVWALLFAPSLGITNSIAFHHIGLALADEAAREKEFSRIRTAGTIGWITAAFALTAWMSLSGADPKAKLGAIPELQLTALLGVAIAVFCLILPHTPPNKKANDPLAFRRAFSLFKTVPGFAVFMVISFVAATEFQFFYVLSAPYLETLSIPHAYIPIVKSISQIAEIVALGVLLPMWLPSKGMRWCLLIGAFAWPLRYLIFAAGQPVELVVASLALHGFGYAFVLVVQQLYVDRVAPADVRGSAQSLLTFVTLGLGNFLGSLFCGQVQGYYTVGKVTNWVPVFILPAILTTLCAVAYALTFRDNLVRKADDSQGLGSAELKTVENG